MTAGRRIPNRLKFSIVMSDKSKLEGAMKCSDEQWNAMWLILLGKVSPSAVIETLASNPTGQQYDTMDHAQLQALGEQQREA